MAEGRKEHDKPLASVTHVHPGSVQLCVQDSMTDQIVALGIRTVESRQWRVRPEGERLCRTC